MVDSRDSIDRVLGSSRSSHFKSLKDDERKRAIEVVLKCIDKMFPNITWKGLGIGYSNADFDELQINLDQLDLELLKITLDIEGFHGVPDEWLEFAEFLAKMQRGKQYACRNMLGDLARLIVLKISGFSSDKVFVKTFYKMPIAQVIRFFKRFKITLNGEKVDNA